MTSSSNRRRSCWACPRGFSSGASDRPRGPRCVHPVDALASSPKPPPPHHGGATMAPVPGLGVGDHAEAPPGLEDERLGLVVGHGDSLPPVRSAEHSGPAWATTPPCGRAKDAEPGIRTRTYEQRTPELGFRGAGRTYACTLCVRSSYTDKRILPVLLDASRLSRSGGAFSSWVLMPSRVVVFIDYQNIYKGARAALARIRPATSTDRSTPSSWVASSRGSGMAAGYSLGSAFTGGCPLTNTTRRATAWHSGRSRSGGKHHLVTPRTRPLNYRNPTEPKEKGIDVQLAIDFVMLAMRDEYDIGILCSADTDLVPALEAVIERKGDNACETAQWLDARRPSHSPLGVKGHVIRKYRMDEAAYRLVHDPTDYNAWRRRR